MAYQLQGVVIQLLRASLKLTEKSNKIALLKNNHKNAIKRVLTLKTNKRTINTLT